MPDKIEMKRQNESMKQLTAKRASAHRQLKRNELRRQNAKGSLKNPSGGYPGLLKESLKAQESLRQLSHKNLSAQEKERRAISRLLQDDIAQMLLSIHVRLLNLRTMAHGNKKTLTNEIARTQRLVEESVKSIHRFARKLTSNHPA